jgi:4-diphosphocytidyl-2C-methyl-D-erythritol kinase
MKNDLQAAAEQFVDLRLPLLSLKEVGAKAALVSGSGPTVFGVFTCAASRDAAYKKLTPLFEERVIKVNTIPFVEPKK